MATPTVFKVNNVDYSDIVAYDGYSVTEEDLHADGSGRNPITGLMEFVVVAQKIHLEINIVNFAPPQRVASLMSALRGNNRVNSYTIFNPNTNSNVVFNGYVNQRSIGVFNRYYKDGTPSSDIVTNLKSFSIKIIEM